MLANLGNSAVATGVEKVFIPIPKKGNTKECSNYCTIVLVSHASKVMLKILQASTVHEARTSRCTSWIQKRQRNQGSSCQQCRIIEKAREFQRNSYCCFIGQSKAFECGSQQTGKLFKRQEYQANLHVSGSHWLKSNTQNQTWKNGLVQNWEKSTSRLYIATLFM